MVRFRTGAIALVLLLAAAAPALAGPVQVFPTWARGDMGTAHNTPTGTSIGCWVSTDLLGPPMMYCEANDGVALGFCYSTNLNLVNTLQSMTTVAEIDFGWDTSHNCSWLMIQSFSQPPGRNH